jgi:beta-galactosidase
MYPGKAFDWEEHRAEQALRHANVLDAVAAQTDIAGSFGWCMFDYNTHKDFGSGDRICYHGVMDLFRNPKLAAAVYASQQEDTPVLELSSSMDIGEHPGSNRGDVYIFTNAEQVRVYKNDRLLNEYTQADSRWKHLAHGPILLDDYVGDALETEEGMPHAQAEAMRALLNTVARVGLYAITPQMLLKWGQLMLRYHMKLEDATRLYNKYIGSWGGEATVYRLDAIRAGEVVKSITKAPMHRVVLRAEADRTALCDGRTYDVAAVRIRAEDEHGNVLPYFNEPVFCEVDGPVQLIGPAAFALQGGMGGTYLKTTGQSGPATLRLQTAQAAAVELAFAVTAEGDAGG